MKQYQLGPNGGIVTSLNLFATKFDQVRAFFLSQTHSAIFLSIFLNLTWLTQVYRIRIQSGQWIRIRIRDTDPGGQK
jgi:hypothetical protein